MPQLKYCRSYSRECGKRSACGGGKRRWGGRRPAAVAPGGWRQGWYWIWWYPGSDAAADYRYHPLIRPPRLVRHSFSFFLSFCRHAARRRAHPKHTRVHTRASTARCVHARVPHALLTSRRGHGHMCRPPQRVDVSYCLSSVSRLHCQLSVSVERGTRRDVTCSLTLFVIFFSLSLRCP